MNILPVVPTLKLASAVTALLGTNPLRVFEDIAPHKTPYPYAIWCSWRHTPFRKVEGGDSPMIQRSWRHTPFRKKS